MKEQDKEQERGFAKGINETGSRGLQPGEIHSDLGALFYREWLRYYLEDCHKESLCKTSAESLERFIANRSDLAPTTP
jgi:hypothetical protein